jgi:hypothetical protein
MERGSKIFEDFWIRAVGELQCHCPRTRCVSRRLESYRLSGRWDPRFEEITAPLMNFEELTDHAAEKLLERAGKYVRRHMRD